MSLSVVMLIVLTPVDSPSRVSFQALLNIDVNYTNDVYPITLPMDVAVEKSLREASVNADKKLSAFSVEMSMKKDVFDNLCLFKQKFGLGRIFF
jgi:hypothetical protein